MFRVSRAGGVPLTDPIRIFVGCAPDGLDAESLAVLDYSLHRHTTRPLDIRWMHHGEGPAFWNGWPTAARATPFSALRWTIPQACGFEGRAIYCDSDMVCLADIADLWDQPMDGKAILLRSTTGKLRTCVMLFDCAAAKPVLPTVAAMKRMPDAHRTIVEGLRERREALGVFEGNWNCIDLKGATELASVKMLHYSRIPEQPHLPLARRRLAAQGRQHWFGGTIAPHRRPEVTEIFLHTLTQAEAAGFAPAKYDHGRFGT